MEFHKMQNIYNTRTQKTAVDYCLIFQQYVTHLLPKETLCQNLG